MEKQKTKSNAAFLRWMKPVLQALKQLGGSGKPQEVRTIIAKNENLTSQELSEIRGKNKVNKFENEVAFARNYLVAGGYIDKSEYGIWKLTEAGMNVNMTDELASEIFKQKVSEMQKNHTQEANYQWIDFYTKFADVLLNYKSNRTDLIKKIREVFMLANMKLPKLEKDDNIEDIDPFTIFALFNKGNSNNSKIKILNSIAKIFDIQNPVPSAFDGVPTVYNLKAAFYCFRDERGKHDIDNLWEVFDNAIHYSKTLSYPYKDNLKKYYDKVKTQKCIGWNITIGLYWIRPNIFINLDSRNREFLSNANNMPHYFTTIFANLEKELPNGSKYLFMCEQARNALTNKEYPYHSFPELSYYAWKTTKEDTKTNTTTLSIDSNIKKTAYWIYSPGDNASMWEEFNQLGIMGIGWDGLGYNLKDFPTKQDIKEYLKNIYDAKDSYKNDAHCLWQFANEIKIGDIIFAKKGVHKIIGKGIVTSDYIYDTSRKSYVHIRKVDWQNIGEWELPRQAVMKTLTNITPYNDYVQELLALVTDEIKDEPEQKIKYPKYTKTDFLNEVYINENSYDTLVDLLDMKYNIILQGAPGVGKTFIAKRLTYSIMGEKDTSRVSMVQFHQNYSYEDFIQGYRPVENGFKLESGSFYKFCKAAEIDDERPYFFIIDEINRGNLSKIFGELMMLIEHDKRGDKLKLLYKDEWFTVPKNIRIIGMMNTADRSLAMIDYALRRRFAFFDVAPAFDSDGFKQYLTEKK